MVRIPKHPGRLALRTIAAGSIALFAAVSHAAAQDAASPPASAHGEDGAIGARLPGQKGGSTCYAGAFDGPIAAVGAEGGEEYENRRIRSLALLLISDDAPPLPYEGGRYGYDRRYSVLLAAELEGLAEPLIGAAECPWRERDVVDPATGAVQMERSNRHFGCFQDCDGGGLRLEASGELGLRLRLGEEGWLRMNASCDGELAFKAAADGLSLELEPAKADVCQPLADRLRGE